MTQGVFEELGISNSTVLFHSHIASILSLSNGKKYYFDPTNATKIAEIKDIKQSGLYYKGKIDFLEKEFIPGGKMKIGKDMSITDKEGYIHFNYFDSEKGALSSILMNKVTISKEKFSNILDINPNDSTYLVGLAKEYVNIGNYEEAIKLCKKALEINNDDIYVKNELGNLYFKIGTLYEKTGNNNEAKVYFKKAIEHGSFYIENLIEKNNKDKNLEILKIGVENFRIKINKDLINSGEDIEFFNILNIFDANNIDLNNIDSLLTLGEAYRLSDSNEIAREYINLAIKKDPKNWKCYYELGKLEEIETKNYQKYLENMQKAWKLIQNDPKKTKEDIALVEDNLKIAKELCKQK